MASFRRGKFPIIALILQVAFIVIFGLLADYDKSATAKDRNVADAEKHQSTYPMFQDVHAMIFVGFGFLMTFLKRYGFSAVGFNLLIAAFVLQWALIVRGIIHGIFGHHDDGEAHTSFGIGINELLTADFAAATILISFGAVLGKTSPLQLLIMALIEVVLAQINEWIGYDLLKTVDAGESMFVHAFGAYFGMAVARVLYSKSIEESTKEGSVYHSDVFAMIGTIFLWIFWPSFNAGAVGADEQHRAIVNTYLSLAACVIVSFAISTMVDHKAKLDMVHIQNATLAGGVAVGTCAHMPIQPWGAAVIGSLAGLISVIGYKYITPFLSSKLKIHDTCGVNNLHGMPGIFAGIAGAVVAAISTFESWGTTVYAIFGARAPAENSTDFIMYMSKNISVPIGDGRTGTEQGGYQMLALLITLLIAIVGGTITGFLLRIPIWDNPKGKLLFEDQDFWEVPEDGFPHVEYTATEEKKKDSTRM